VRGVTLAVATAALAAAPPVFAQPATGRPSPDDACRAGLAHERAGALPQAFLELSRCSADGAEPAPTADASAAFARVKKKLAAGDFAPVSFSLSPSTAEIRIAPFTDRAPLGQPHTLWLPFGRYHYVATAPGHLEVRGEIVVDSTARIHQQVALEPARRAAPPRAVDFESEGPAVDEPIVVADPRPKKHPSLIPKRFRGGLDGEHGSADRSARSTATARRPPARAWPWILTWGL